MNIKRTDVDNLFICIHMSTSTQDSPSIFELQKHAFHYIAELLESCPRRGAFTLQEVDGLLSIVKDLRSTADEFGDSVKLSGSPLLLPAWEHLQIAQERGKLTLQEAWSVYNAMQICNQSSESESESESQSQEDLDISASNGSSMTTATTSTVSSYT